MARKREQRPAAEDHGRGDQSGRILSREQHLARRRREEPVVQRAVAHLAAEEIHEHAEATEEDRQPQVEELEDAGEDRPVLFEVQHGDRVLSRLQLAVDEREPDLPLGRRSR